MLNETISHKELEKRYEQFSRGVYPEYKKEHNTWKILE